MDASLTHSSAVALETEKTEETGIADNQAFLHAVFAGAQQENRPVLVSFKGNPAKVPNSFWSGRAWLGDDGGLAQEDNNYFSLAVFKPDEVGQYRRKKAQFAALHAVMLDDVGTKVPMDRLTLRPSWMIETSPGNFQAGYLLREPMTDVSMVDCLMNAIIVAGLCDPGANGPCARLARLPNAFNGKHEPSFPCRLANWSPELRYSYGELVAGLELEVKPPGRPKRTVARQSQPSPQDGDPIWLPRPSENRVLAALRERGLYKAPLGDGKHDITCPWVNEHTGGIDRGTAYFEPNDSWPIGGFKCFHGHCADRHIRDLLAFLGIEVSAARMKATIRVVPGEMDRVVDAAERELAQRGHYYQRGGLIVTVSTDPGTRGTRIQELTLPALVRALAGAATWERHDARSQDWARIDPPPRHAAVLFDATSYPHLPVLNNLARQPYLRPDGTLMREAGFDAVTGMFGVFDARDFEVPESPTRKDAEKAMEMLNSLLVEFSFANDFDRAAALGAILTASVRPSLRVAPMFHVRAHMPGSGKSYLCELITAFATPRHGTPTSFPGDDEECRKLMLAELLHAPAVIEFDNLTTDLIPHKSLCTALTSEFMSGRILGVSKTATVSTRVLFLSSGNNVGPVQDMTRRCISIHLAPQCEVPATQCFTRPDLVSDVLNSRGQFVSAALTIIRAWIVAGRPKRPCKALASYGEWSDLCRQSLLWLGVPDPTASIFESMAEDPDRETLLRLLEAWQGAFGKIPAMVRDAVNQASSSSKHSELFEVLLDIAGERGEVNRRKLGWWLRRHAGRIVDGRRIVPAKNGGSAEHWKIDAVETVSSVFEVSVGLSEKSVNDENVQFARASSGDWVKE